MGAKHLGAPHCSPSRVAEKCSWPSYASFEHFSLLAKVVTILNDTTMSSPSPQQRAAFFLGQFSKLEEWRAELPRHCSLDIETTFLTPPVANLHILYDSIVQYLTSAVHTDSDTEAYRHFRSFRLPRAKELYHEIFGVVASRSTLALYNKLSEPSSHYSSEVQNTDHSYRNDDQDQPQARLETMPSADLINLSAQSGSSISNPRNHGTPLSDSQTVTALDTDHHPLDTFPSVSSKNTANDSLPLNRPSRVYGARDGRALQRLIDELSAEEIGYDPPTSQFHAWPWILRQDVLDKTNSKHVALNVQCVSSRSSWRNRT